MENKPKSAVIIASNRPYCAAFLSCLEKQGDRLCRGCEKMLDKGQPHMGRCSASLFEQYMHNCTITQRSQFRDDSRIMQSFLIGRLLSSAFAADWRYDCSEVEYLNLHRYAMRHIYMLALIYCALCYCTHLASSSHVLFKKPWPKSKSIVSLCASVCCQPSSGTVISISHKSA